MTDENTRSDDESEGETEPVPNERESPSFGRDREERLRQIDAWAEYVRTHPDDVWGPQVNAVIESQLEHARANQFDRPDLAHMRDPAEEDNDIRRPPIARDDESPPPDDEPSSDDAGDDDPSDATSDE
ncbi:hypothetical protein RYH80_08840 [Halobaculum sp. MBLA0147]|uniref:hypothetical protein n=1 Tax=Halobaculum sp. MBLA0147 TaxID=3079934 RepID=UPI003526A495